MRRSYSGSGVPSVAEIGILLAIFVALLAMPIVSLYVESIVSNATIEVTKTEVSGGRGAENFVYTKADETFVVDDSWLEWLGGNPMAFRSRDTFGKIHPGKTYTVRCRGWRWPFFSSHRNIVALSELPEIEGAK